MNPILKVKKLHPDAILPKYQTAGAACFDLHTVTDGVVFPDSACRFDTHLSFEIPEGHVMLVYSRSGHGFKNNVRLVNCTGIIDSDYRASVQVALFNDSEFRFTVEAGDRIAQAMIIPVQQFQIIEVGKLGDTERGTGGFGSTGS